MHPKQPNTKQKKFREQMRMLGMGDVIHHATDRTMRIKACGNIGHWWLIPCDQPLHQRIHAMGRDRKPFEKARFAAAIDRYAEVYQQPAPLPDGVYNAIMEFHR